MNIFPRKSKEASGQFYFGEFNENPRAPFSVSVATFDEGYEGELTHYHKNNDKAYITISGKGILTVEGNEVELREDQMIHVEHAEKHALTKVVEAPLKIVVVLASKSDDKVVIES